MYPRPKVPFKINKVRRKNGQVNDLSQGCDGNLKICKKL